MCSVTCGWKKNIFWYRIITDSKSKEKEKLICIAISTNKSARLNQEDQSISEIALSAH